MKHIKETLVYIKNNKLRTLACYGLDLLFLIIIVMTFMNFLPTWVEYAEQTDSILTELQVDSINDLPNVYSRSNEINYIKNSMENIMGKILMIIFTAGNIIYALWASIMIKKLKPWYMATFVIISYLLQFIMWILYSLMISFKISVSSMVADTTKISLLIFIIFCYIAYYKLYIFMLKIDDKKGIKSGFNKYVKFIFSKKIWSGLWRYVVASIIFFPLILLSQAPVLSGFTGTKMILSLIIVILIVIPYATISKLYIIKSIENS